MPEHPYELWRIDTGKACGGVILNEKRRVFFTAPYFRKCMNYHLQDLLNICYARNYKLEFVETISIEELTPTKSRCVLSSQSLQPPQQADNATEIQSSTQSNSDVGKT